MKARAKGKIIGALWGVLSMVSLLWLSDYIGYTRLDEGTYIRNDELYVQFIRILILPAFLSARIVLAPVAGALIIWPFASIIFGALIGYIIGRWKEK